MFQESFRFKNFSIIFSTPEILSSISSIILVKLPSVIPVHLPRFLISRIHWVCAFLMLIFPFSGLEHFCPFSSTVCFFLSFFRGFIHFLQYSVYYFFVFFKGFVHILCSGLLHLYKVYFQAFYLGFSSIGVLRVIVVGYLGARGDILPWMLFVILSWHLGI